MARPGGALRYAELGDATSVHTSARKARVRDHDDGFGSERDADTDKLRMKFTRDGQRTLARLDARMKARAARAELRDTLDLIRQDELLENMERREARRRQRRWYVMG